MQELWFVCKTRFLNVLYKSIKYKRLLVIERTRFCDGQTHEQTQGGNIHARAIVLVHYTSSECALQMYEVSLKYL